MNEKLDRLLEQYSAAAGEFWLEESLPEDIPEHTFPTNSSGGWTSCCAASGAPRPCGRH